MSGAVKGIKAKVQSALIFGLILIDCGFSSYPDPLF